MRCFSVSRLLLGALVAALLSACQPLPQPFAEEADAEDNPLLGVPESYGLVIGPVAGLRSEEAAIIRERLASSLEGEQVLATTGSGNPRAYRLVGRAADGQSEPEIDWELRAPDGVVVHRFENVDAAVSGSSGFAREVAGVMRATLSDGRPSGETAMAPEPPLLTLLSIEGAPGDGARSLPRALAAALTIRGLRLTGEEDARLGLHGTVNVEPVRPGIERIDILWSVLIPGGERVGTVEQSNEIPSGSLDGPWGPIAQAAAEGAAEGIVGVIESLRANTARGP